MAKQSLVQPELYNLIAEPYKLLTCTTQSNSPAVIAIFVNSKLHKDTTCCWIIVLDFIIFRCCLFYPPVPPLAKSLIYCLLLPLVVCTDLLVLCIHTAETFPFAYSTTTYFESRHRIYYNKGRNSNKSAPENPSLNCLMQQKAAIATESCNLFNTRCIVKNVMISPLMCKLAFVLCQGLAKMVL